MRTSKKINCFQTQKAVWSNRQSLRLAGWIATTKRKSNELAARRAFEAKSVGIIQIPNTSYNDNTCHANAVSLGSKSTAAEKSTKKSWKSILFSFIVGDRLWIIIPILLHAHESCRDNQEIVKLTGQVLITLWCRQHAETMSRWFVLSLWFTSKQLATSSSKKINMYYTGAGCPKRQKPAKRLIEFVVLLTWAQFLMESPLRDQRPTETLFSFRHISPKSDKQLKFASYCATCA